MILCVGTSHRFVSVRVLEHAHREATALGNAFSAAARSGRPAFPFTELVVLATCNRVELYVACEVRDAERALALLHSTLDGGVEDSRVYVQRGRAALLHLCRVAAGLDSLVLGEPQIAGQVAAAFEAGAAGTILRAAGAVARRAGARARAETGIARGPVSISSVAVRLAADRVGGLAGRRILVLGAGKIGRITCEVLKSSGAHMTVANRTAARAEALARRVGASARPLAELPALLAAADVVIASTAAPAPLIGPEALQPVLAERRARPDARPLLLVDIAVPCNVDERVRELAGVELVGIDDLRGRVAVHLEERKAAVPAVERIIEEELTGAVPIQV